MTHFTQIAISYFFKNNYNSIQKKACAQSLGNPIFLSQWLSFYQRVKIKKT